MTLDWCNSGGLEMEVTAVRFAALLDTKQGIKKCKESTSTLFLVFYKKLSVQSCPYYRMH